jgi:curved DNA-binding protein CbpA
MPLRIAPFRAAAHLVAQAASRTRPPPCASCLFHTSPVLRRDETDDKNHYETLGVQTSASPKDIKRSFYHLSKTHHPDHNRDDPLASKRFMRISEAYSVLSHTERRAKYDRDVLRLHDQCAAAAGPQHRAGSYSSTGPAGGRPASGLSRRRGTFRGPPPSFYRSGGWGAHGTKRSQAHGESTSGAGSGGSHHEAHHHGHHHHRPYQQHQPASEAHGFGSGASGPRQEPFGGSGEMPHFDRTAKAAHTRTQSRFDDIRVRNAAKKPRFPSASGDYGEVGSFFAVLAVLGVAVGLPYLVMRGWDRPDKKQKKTQG